MQFQINVKEKKMENVYIIQHTVGRESIYSHPKFDSLKYT